MRNVRLERETRVRPARPAARARRDARQRVARRAPLTLVRLPRARAQNELTAIASELDQVRKEKAKLAAAATPTPASK